MAVAALSNIHLQRELVMYSSSGYDETAWCSHVYIDDCKLYLLRAEDADASSKERQVNGRPVSCLTSGTTHWQFRRRLCDDAADAILVKTHTKGRTATNMCTIQQRC